MRIGVLSEGTTEEGRASLQKPLERIPEAAEGALHVLVRRIAACAGPEPVEFVAPPRTRKRGKGGLLKDLRRILPAFNMVGIDVVVAVLDRAEDNQTLGNLESAVEQAATPVKTVSGEAVQMFEAWLIADVVALREELGLKDLVPGRDPETRPGFDDDPESPKRYLGRLMESTGEKDQIAFKKRLAMRIDIDETARICRKGFDPFRRNLMKIVGGGCIA